MYIVIRNQNITFLLQRSG